MKQKYFLFFLSVIVFLFFMTLSGAFFTSDSVQADISTVCCDSGDELGDYCVYNVGVPGVCRAVEGVYEDSACGGISGLNLLICDDDIHAGTYLCNCVPIPAYPGTFDCRISTTDCSADYRPGCTCINPQSYDPCGGSVYCNLECVPGTLGELGDPCQCPGDCSDGFVCDPYTNECHPDNYLLECCDGLTDTSCPERDGYTNPRCVLDTQNLSGCPEDVNGDVYHCVWDPPLSTPAPTTYPPVATPPPLPPTDWSLLYRTLQPTPGLFTFSSALTVGGVISPMLRIIFPIAGLILLLMIIYGGYNWMLSAGDPKKAARAKEIITVALIGFIIIFTSYWLVQIIGSILGLGTIGIIF